MNYTDTLPIQGRAMQRAISLSRDNYYRTIQTFQWPALIDVAKTHRIEHDDFHSQKLIHPTKKLAGEAQSPVCEVKRLVPEVKRLARHT